MRKPSAEVGTSIAALGAILAGTLLLQMAGTVIGTVVPLRMAVSGQPAFVIGIVASAFSLGFVLGCVGIPSVVRRVGHIRSFTVFAALLAIATLSIVFLPEPWWGLPRFVMGLSAAGYSICIESWISGQASGAQRGRVFSTYQILSRIMVIGSQIGVGYVALQSYEILLVVSMVYSFALIPVALTRARAPETSEALPVDLRSLWVQAPTAVVGCLYVGMVGAPLSNLAPAYGILSGLDQRASIFLTAAIQIGALLLQWPIARLADRIASRQIMLVSIGVVTTASAALILLPQFGAGQNRFWLFGLFAIAGGCSIPLYAVAVAHAYLRMGRDRAVGLSAKLLLLWGIGSAIGPFAAALPMQVLGASGMLVYIVCLSAAVVAFIAVRISTKPLPPLIEGQKSLAGPVTPDAKTVTR